MTSRGERIFTCVVVSSFGGVGVAYLGLWLDIAILYWTGLILAIPVLLIFGFAAIFIVLSPILWPIFNIRRWNGR